MIRFLLALLSAVLLTVLSRGLLSAANTLGYHPEEWVAEAILGATTTSGIEAAAWSLAGLSGLVLVIFWEWTKLGNRLARWLPQTSREIDREEYDALTDLIGQSMLCGRMLYTVNMPDRDKARKLLGKWKASTCNLITDGISSGEIWRFLSNDGIVTFSGNKDDIDIEVERRLVRLNEIIVNIMPTKCSPGFNSQTWDGEFEIDKYS